MIGHRRIFNKPEEIKTDFGIVNTRIGRYFTHRNTEHFFRKFQGFGISLPEIEIAKKHYCSHILIKYHGKRKNILFKFMIRDLKFMKIYNNDGDEQYIIPVKHMRKMGEEVGLDEHDESGEDEKHERMVEKD